EKHPVCDDVYVLLCEEPSATKSRFLKRIEKNSASTGKSPIVTTFETCCSAIGTQYPVNREYYLSLTFMYNK
ncbi:unnamed protein product, partial [Rotaria magnacalcarata]